LSGRRDFWRFRFCLRDHRLPLQSRGAARAPAFHVLHASTWRCSPRPSSACLARPGQALSPVRRNSGWAPLQLQAGSSRETAVCACRFLPSVDLLFRKDTAACGASLLAEARGEHAARENPMRRCSVYFAYEASPPQPAAPRGVAPRRRRCLSRRKDAILLVAHPRVPRPRVPADGADRGACAERGARRVILTAPPSARSAACSPSTTVQKVIDPVYDGGPFSRGALVAWSRPTTRRGAGAVLLMKERVPRVPRHNTIDHASRPPPTRRATSWATSAGVRAS